jgi:sigma-B regulation protein RsbU (phosphoserine phosphatase)
MSGATTLKDSTVGPPAQVQGAGAPGAPQSPRAGQPPGGTHPTSIADFLTDGSLPALCAELSRLTGVPVELRDSQERLIVMGTGQPGPGNWRVVDDGKGIRRDGAKAIPLRLGALPIGWIVLGEQLPEMAADSRERLESALSFLALTATELCQHEVELRHRIKEVAALTRMSSLLVRAAGPDRVLEVALDSALDVLELDAGSIVLLKEDADGVSADTEADLILKASRNLSQDWLTCPLPLSKDRVFDRLALSRQLVIVEDIKNDPRILIPDRAAAENLGAAIHVGMVFKNRPQGVIRLYSRRPRGFDEGERRLLLSLAEQAAAALEQSRLLKFEQEEQRVQRQLQLAADVQRRMLPRSIPTIPKLDMAARYVPSFELGGDFYDFIDLNGHLGLMIGDVVGKGIAAALLMSAVRASLRAHVQEVYDLDEVVARVNKALYQDTRDNEFASLWYGVLDPAKLRLTYCSAGHEPPFVVHIPKGRPVTEANMSELSVGGMVVGIDPSQRYQRAVFDLRPRDLIVAYTDGLVDTTNFSGERFGKKRLRAAVLKLLGEAPESTAAQVVDRIMWEVRQFAGLSPRPDDQTVIAVRVV